MSIVSPEQIVAKSHNAYRRFLKRWIREQADEFFPCRLPVDLKVDSNNPSRTIAENELLLKKSKSQRGWGYTVHREQIRKRDFGNNLFPKSVTIDTLDDLLRLTNNTDHFEAVQSVARQVRQSLPSLNDWLISHIHSLHQHADSIEGLVRVTQFFIENPFPDCYMRQIPASVETKFIEKHRSTLRQWFDLLLPLTGIDVNESKFARRFGLRDDQTHRAIKFLDLNLQQELNLPFEELSLPLRSLATIPVKNSTIFIVENNLNLLTLPAFPRGMAIRGEGNAVNRLESLDWLSDNQIIYWGDLDVDGFLILSRLRNIFPHTQSLMMNHETLLSHEAEITSGNETTPTMPTNLTPCEAIAFEYCLKNNARLEQERIGQAFVEQTVSQLSQNDS